VIVGANNSLPQLRQKLSPGVAGVPHCGQIVAFKVGSLIGETLDVWLPEHSLFSVVE
jgi:hypothetical protein